MNEYIADVPCCTYMIYVCATKRNVRIERRFRAGFLGDWRKIHAVTRLPGRIVRTQFANITGVGSKC